MNTKTKGEIMRVLIALSILLTLSGCSSKLMVFDSEKKETIGIPFNVPQLVAIKTLVKYKVVKGSEDFADYCTSETTVKKELLPLGERYYINFDPAQLGDAEFGVEFNDKGLVKSITLNSKASAGSEQANALLTSVLPYVSAPKEVSEEKALIQPGQTAQKLKEKHCIKASSEIISITKIDI